MVLQTHPAALVVYTEAALAARQLVVTEPLVPVEQSALSGPVQLVASPQQIRAIYNDYVLWSIYITSADAKCCCKYLGKSAWCANNRYSYSRNK
jgi:hypothetical protein